MATSDEEVAAVREQIAAAARGEREMTVITSREEGYRLLGLDPQDQRSPVKE